MPELHKCPRCNSPWKKAKAFNGAESEFWMECTNPHCNTYYNTYKPQPHQYAFHTDNHRYTANFGGYGSGKTLTSREEIYKHFFITPNGNTIIGANVISQYEQTLKREIEADIPAAFVRNYSTMKAYMDLKNGHRIMYRPFDDPDKLRSYNITQFVILEASEVHPGAFTQLKTRLRNTAATTQKCDENGTPIFDTKDGAKIPVIEHDWRRGIIESNPGTGWIRDQVLMFSDKIYTHGTNYDNYEAMQTEADKDPAISTHITSTDANAYLPKDFIATVSANKPRYWVYRYVYGSFLYASGAIYPTVADCIVPSFDVPKDWKRVVAFDYGLRDPSVFLLGAIDERHGLLYIYKECSINEVNIKAISEMYHEAVKDIPSGGLLTSLIIDPKSGPRRDYEKKSLADWFLDYGIATQPGVISKDVRIFRTNTYIESKVLKIMDCCHDLIQEMRDYKWKTDEKSHTGFSDKPEDGKDHSISCLEWICCRLPADPKNLVYGAYDIMGRSLTEAKQSADPGYWALSDDTPYSPQDDSPFDAQPYF